MKKCIICGTKISNKNDGLFLQNLGFEDNEISKIKELTTNSKNCKNGLCIMCKREMLFANII